MRRRGFWFCFVIALIFGAGVRPAWAQGPPVNLFGSNAGFEESVVDDNLWDGVTRDGFLSGHPFSATVVGDGGLHSTALPPSVAWADLNGDGKPDLLIADGLGYFYFFPNVGTATQPKFTNAEVLPLFLSANPRRKADNSDWDKRFDNLRKAPRFALADWRHSGLLDLMVGTYGGELFFVPNTGTARKPVYRQPQPVETARLKPGPRDGLPFNLLAPAAADLRGSGRPDLLLGEGTYSANAVRWLENVGTDAPRFSEDRMQYVAYGDGKEVLIPAVVDYNENGKLDLLVADRTGKVSLFLQPASGWKPGQEMPFASVLTFGDRDRLPGLVSPCVADFNSNGLFDLIFGLPNGRIAVALNTGTRGQPKFDSWQELRGEKRLPLCRMPPHRNRKDWKVDTSILQGNALAYGVIVNTQEDPACAPPEGTNCMKFGYWPGANKFFIAQGGGETAASRHCSLEHHFELKIGHTYTLTFKVRSQGGGFRLRYKVLANLRYNSAVNVKIETKERGGVKKIFALEDDNFAVTGEYNPTSAWTTCTRTFTFQTGAQELPKDTLNTARLYVDFDLTRQDAVIYFDDFQLIETSSR